MERYTGLVGLVGVMAVAYFFSTDRKAIRPRVVLWGLALQLAFALLVLKTPFVNVFKAASTGVKHMLNFAAEGSKFMFGEQLGGKEPVIFAFQVLPIIIFIASLFGILYYLGIMQVFIRWMAKAMQWIMGTSGAESTNVAASIFMGQTEAPLTIRPFLANLTQSELFTVMVSGMAHVSGAVMGAYVAFANVKIEHLLTAVIMTAPATLMLSKMMIPETGEPETAGTVKVEVEKNGVNVIDAAARGAGDGLQLVLNIAAMLIAFIALIALVNGALSSLHDTRFFAWVPPSLPAIFARVFSPIAWSLGVKWDDCATVGSLLGTRLALNEFVAFIDLGKIGSTATGGQLDPRSFTIATFALCGFANLSSIAIQVGGIGALAPSRKSDLARLGLRAVACGTMANFMSACIAGMLL